MTKDLGWTDTGEHKILREAVQAHHGEDVSNPDGEDGNDSCVEIHGNEEWIGDYERMSDGNVQERDQVVHTASFAYRPP